MRRALVAGNWKMHGSADRVREVLGALREGVASGADEADIAICPPFPYLALAQELLRDSRIALGAQNAWYEPEGAWTGEVSVGMLREFGVRYVLIGHSERRQHFGEDDALVARKFEAVREAGATPILCVGESLAQREAGEAEQVVAGQLQAVIDRVGSTALQDAVLAYEPVWAIGTGHTATPEQAQAMHAGLRQRVAAQDAETAAGVRIVYGGSVKADNASELFACPDIDGGLIGGASLDAASFERICNSVS